MFQDYDFANNALEFSAEGLPFLARDAYSASGIQVADAVVQAVPLLPSRHGC